MCIEVLTRPSDVAYADRSTALCNEILNPTKEDTVETATHPTVIGPTDGKLVTLQTLGVRFMIPGDDTDGRFSLVEHPIPPLSLAAPLHRHSHEDEYSYVLEGRMGALLGDEVVYAEVGDLVYKPRGQWHTFWNAIDGPTRILEIISPSGFEQFFEELADIVVDGVPDESRFGPLRERYGLDMQLDSVPGLIERFGLRFPGAE
jgi:mannose-6-phosphate isomerase-like protein (cupin superfamily)